jgi:hypothetical protein
MSLLTIDTEVWPVVVQTSSAILAACAQDMLVSNNSAIPAANLRKLLEREFAMPQKMIPSM